MRETREMSRSASVEASRAELLAEAMEEVGIRARRYIQEPDDGAWHDLVRALGRTHGDSESYELLRAVEIHTLASRPR